MFVETPGPGSPHYEREKRVKARNRYRSQNGLTWGQVNALWSDLEPGGGEPLADTDHDEPANEFACATCERSWKRKSDSTRHYQLHPTHEAA